MINHKMTTKINNLNYTHLVSSLNLRGVLVASFSTLIHSKGNNYLGVIPYKALYINIKRFMLKQASTLALNHISDVTLIPRRCTKMP
jgi:hypothetical protein